MSESLKQRVITAILMGVPILLLLFINDNTRMIFIGLLSGLLLYEYLSLFYRINSDIIKYILSFSGTALLLYSAFHLTDYYSYFLFSSLFINVLLLAGLFLRKLDFHQKAPWLSGILYLVLPLSLLIFIKDEKYFAMVILSAIVLSWISDISAYFVGKSIGKNKLMPRISPGKTWEGFLGAGMIVMIFSFFFSSYSDVFTFNTWILIGLSVWLFGVGGDLVESNLKRSMQLKDSGSILPGHGGFLDRFDGFYFGIPFVLLVVKLCV